LKGRVGKNKWAILGLVLGVILIGSASAYYILSSVAEESINWKVTLISSSGEQKVITYNEIRRMPYQEASGGLLTSAGVVYGPYNVKGVLLQDLCDLAGGITPNDIVSVSAPDGYSMAFGYDQLYSPDFPTWDPATLHEVSHENQRILLTYEWNGKAISNNDGGPLRLVVVSDGSLLTEGHNWVMWVDEIEIDRLD
jgi:DMSO/TMAO reductase YedYZ molybdopterin-dependent catalytic subunit